MQIEGSITTDRDGVPTGFSFEMPSMFPGDLRDWFAIAAIREASLPSNELENILGLTDPTKANALYQREINKIAMWAYKMADAMLAERNK